MKFQNYLYFPQAHDLWNYCGLPNDLSHAEIVSLSKAQAKHPKLFGQLVILVISDWKAFTSCVDSTLSIQSIKPKTPCASYFSKHIDKAHGLYIQQINQA